MMFYRLTVMMVVWGCFVFSEGKCQDPPRVIPPSPNAAALGKYADIPVSLYSGTADITIPLYEIKTGDISVPISLSYHTAGIRITELAGWTGLGFVLNAGGAISRNIVGNDDLLRTATSNQPEVKSTTLMRAAVSFMFPGETGTQNLYSAKNEKFDFSQVFGSIEGYDLEYDVFSYNFQGRTGKFIIDHDGHPVLEKAEDLRIEFTTGTVYPEFRITDENGFIYHFNAVEVVSREQPISSPAISWYLSQIESAKGYTVNFAYTSLHTLQGSQDQETSMIGCNSSPSGLINTTTSSFPYTTALILDSITFDNGSIDVLIDDDRDDYHGQKITGLKIRSAASGKTVKEVTFGYDYFPKNAPSNGLFYTRLKLTSVTEMANGITLPPYTFGYYEPEDTYQLQFTNVGSNSVDHWGYFNGISNLYILPQFTGNIDVGNGSTLVSLPGGNRSASSTVASVFSLKGIRYPTGGHTVINLETNTHEYGYTDVVSDPEPVYVPGGTTILVEGAGKTVTDTLDLSRAEGQIKVEIGFVCSNVNDYESVRHYPYGSITFEIGGILRDVAGDLVTCDGKACSATLYLDGPGLYRYTGHIGSNVTNGDFQFISVHLSWMEKQYQYGSERDQIAYAGGLRVASMITYNENNEVIRSKRYDYHYQKDQNGDGHAEVHSYGRRISQPLYTRYELTVAGGDPNGSNPVFCKHFKRYSSSVVPLTTAVGYDQVTEYSIDNTRKNASNKTVHYFYNDPDSTYGFSVPSDLLNGVLEGVDNIRPFGMPNLSYATNGLLKSKIDYVMTDNGYQAIHETRNTWTNKVLMNYYSVRYETFFYGNGNMQMMMPYPALRSQRIELTSTEEILYDLANGTSMASVDYFEYGKTHTQQVKHIRKESNGRTITEYKVYAPDYSGISTSVGGIKTLQDKHVLAAPVEAYVTAKETPSSLEKVLKGTLTTYRSDNPVPDVVYSLQTGSALPYSNFTISNSVPGTFLTDSLYKPSLNFQAYTTRGNIKQLAKTNDASVSYMWAYNENYPIAEVKNCAVDKFLYAGFETEVSNVSSDARTGNKSYTSPYTVTLPAAGSYTLTYWRKHAAEGWKLVRVGNVTGNQTIGGTGDLIDEVRLFPTGSSMTTYTYDPLVGMTSMTDANNVTIYYEYDALQRLSVIRDQSGNIVKRYTYNYLLK